MSFQTRRPAARRLCGFPSFARTRFNSGTVEVGADEAKLSYRDNTGAVIYTLTLPEEL